MQRSRGFIDIHTHILPGVDDGSGSMAETIRMLHIAQEQQISTIIATPHYAIGATNTPVEQLTQLKEQVQVEAHKISKDLNILLGNELYYSDSILEALKSKEALTLAGSKYVLIEFNTRETYNNMYKGLDGMIRAGFLPVIAHIERFRCLLNKEYLISDLIGLGCYIQMNSNSLIGNLFNKEANYNRKLLNLGLVHFIGSDCHDDKIRIPSMKNTVNTLQKKCEEGLLENILYDNPVSILENTYI